MFDVISLRINGFQARQISLLTNDFIWWGLLKLAQIITWKLEKIILAVHKMCPHSSVTGYSY